MKDEKLGRAGVSRGRGEGQVLSLSPAGTMAGVLPCLHILVLLLLFPDIASALATGRERRGGPKASDVLCHREEGQATEVSGGEPVL